MKVFLAAFLIAGAWVAYLRAVGAGYHLLAGVADAALIGLSGVVTLGYVEDRRMLRIAMWGGGLGTALASWLTR